MVVRIAAAVTSHNRCRLTLRFLERLWGQEFPTRVALSVFLVDDGSTDGTSDEVKSHFPMVKLINGNGQLYWTGGMRLAMTEAMKTDPDLYWWLNDDTLLDSDALARLVRTHDWLVSAGTTDPIVVGSVRDPDSTALTYGGAARSSWWHPLRFRLIEPDSVPVACDAMNGNCVLIPRGAVRKVGNLDPGFTQGRGDYDYALRARKAGCTVWVAPGYYGICRRNSPQRTRCQRPVCWQEWVGRAMSPRGLPPLEWALFAKRHAGCLWPVFWVSPYVRILAQAFLEPLRRPRCTKNVADGSHRESQANRADDVVSPNAQKSVGK
jgi:GT2 family glycosyltransferase